MMMATILGAASTVGEDSPWQHMGRRFREHDGAVQWSELLLVVGVVGGTMVLVWLLARLWHPSEHRPYYSRWGLFRQLCRAHRLSWRQSWLLWRLARAHQLTQPACLFLDESRFEVESLPQKLAQREEELTALRAQLFAVK